MTRAPTGNESHLFEEVRRWEASSPPRPEENVSDSPRDRASRILAAVYRFLVFFLRILKALPLVRLRRLSESRSDTFRMFSRSGWVQMPFSLGLSFAAGTVLGAWFAGAPIARENSFPHLWQTILGVVPVLVGCVFAFRLGPAMTRELMVLRDNEEVAALESMGLCPVEFLVRPRVLGVALSLAGLSVLGSLTCFVGAGLTFAVWGFLLQESVPPVLAGPSTNEILALLGRSLLFGVWVGSLASFEGLDEKGGLAGGARSKNAASVWAMTFIFVSEVLFRLAFSPGFEGVD